MNDFHRFWFGEMTLSENYYQKKILQWFFGKDLSFDSACAQYENATGHSRLMEIIRLDQIPRNVYRQDHRAFMGDEKALRLAQEAIEAGDEKRLSLPERIFLYMPFEHAENLHHQSFSVQKFEELHDEAPAGIKSWTQLGVKKAKDHFDVIEKFGRFPTRNKKMGRQSTPLEEKFLKGL